jgi:hypothetical protein
MNGASSGGPNFFNAVRGVRLNSNRTVLAAEKKVMTQQSRMPEESVS